MRKKGETPEFRAFLEGKHGRFAAPNQRTQQIWLLGKEERWDWRRDTANWCSPFETELFAHQRKFLAHLTGRDNTWLWAWANSSVTDSLARDSRQVRECGEQHNVQRSHNTSMAGVANLTVGKWRRLHVGCAIQNGAYRGLAGTTFVLLLSAKFQITKR